MTLWSRAKLFMVRHAELIRRLWCFGRRFGPIWKKALWANVFSGLGSLCQLTMPLFGLWLIDKALPEGDKLLLLQLASGMITALLLAMVASYFEFLQAASFREHLSLKLELTVFDHVQHLPISFFKQHDSGYLMSRINNDCNVAVGMLGNLAHMGKSIVLLTGGAFLLPVLHPLLGLLVLATIPIHVILLFWFNHRIKEEYRVVQEKTALASKDLFESLSGIAEIRLFGAERHNKRRYGKRLIARSRSNIKAMLLAKIGGQVSQMVTLITSLVILIGGGFAVIRDALTIGELVGMNAIAAFLLPSLNALVNQTMSAQKSIAAMERIDDILEKQPEPQRIGPPIKSHLKGHILFDNVSFGYREDHSLIDNLTLEIHPGEKVLLSGSSGNGKTTLIHLLFGFYQPRKGKIRIDGVELEKLGRNFIRSQMALVSQDVFLFSDTVENNIKIANPKASTEEIRKAAEMANALSFIEELPQGFHTMTGERGARLSGGQRQRIALARAFLADAPILVLDEATSAVDQASEVLIHDAISRAMVGRTTLIIAHHAGAFAHSLDNLWQLEHGRITRDHLSPNKNRSELERITC